MSWVDGRTSHCDRDKKKKKENFMGGDDDLVLYIFDLVRQISKCSNLCIIIMDHAYFHNFSIIVHVAVFMFASNKKRLQVDISTKNN